VSRITKWLLGIGTAIVLGGGLVLALVLGSRSKSKAISERIARLVTDERRRIWDQGEESVKAALQDELTGWEAGQERILSEVEHEATTNPDSILSRLHGDK